MFMVFLHLKDGCVGIVKYGSIAIPISKNKAIDTGAIARDLDQYNNTLVDTRELLNILVQYLYQYKELLNILVE